ncbi:VanZ family protein [Paenibacillus protaetiae]|uniref:VanZ-like domain-containing protein n=1 Tax=Paenibacillus protaetiae TaxID=2509456 RepID=A0A4P6EV08_9BACL|nr:VanZ family protein [Paenibacillus protaetiae]QAY65479.1 hypothetical protein ET464_02890 [Paenibacillus protaetiae]
MKQVEDHQSSGSSWRIVRWLPAVVWMAVIFFLSSRTGDDVNSFLPFFHHFFPQMQDFNWGHFISYFVLAATLDYGFGAKAQKAGFKIGIILLCGLYGVTDEYHQSFVDGRSSDWHDIRNDMIGASIMVLLIMVPALQQWWRKLKRLNRTR